MSYYINFIEEVLQAKKIQAEEEIKSYQIQIEKGLEDLEIAQIAEKDKDEYVYNRSLADLIFELDQLIFRVTKTKNKSGKHEEVYKEAIIQILEKLPQPLEIEALAKNLSNIINTLFRNFHPTLLAPFQNIQIISQKIASLYKQHLDNIKALKSKQDDEKKEKINENIRIQETLKQKIKKRIETEAEMEKTITQCKLDIKKFEEEKEEKINIIKRLALVPLTNLSLQHKTEKLMIISRYWAKYLERHADIPSFDDFRERVNFYKARKVCSETDLLMTNEVSEEILAAIADLKSLTDKHRVDIENKKQEIKENNIKLMEEKNKIFQKNLIDYINKINPDFQKFFKQSFIKEIDQNDIQDLRSSVFKGQDALLDEDSILKMNNQFVSDDNPKISHENSDQNDAKEKMHEEIKLTTMEVDKNAIRANRIADSAQLECSSHRALNFFSSLDNSALLPKAALNFQKIKGSMEEEAQLEMPPLNENTYKKNKAENILGLRLSDIAQGFRVSPNHMKNKKNCRKRKYCSWREVASHLKVNRDSLREKLTSIPIGQANVHEILDKNKGLNEEALKTLLGDAYYKTIDELLSKSLSNITEEKIREVAQGINFPGSNDTFLRIVASRLEIEVLQLTRLLQAFNLSTEELWTVAISNKRLSLGEEFNLKICDRTIEELHEAILEVKEDPRQKLHTKLKVGKKAVCTQLINSGLFGMLNYITKEEASKRLGATYKKYFKLVDKEQLLVDLTAAPRSNSPGVFSNSP